MKISDVKNCDFSSWYPMFKGSTIKSTILDVPLAFVDYLNADGIILPESCSAQSASNQSDSEDETDWEQEETAPVAVAPDFGDFEVQIKNTIKHLGGAVFPKLNWSAPKDAIWISCGNTLKCTSPSDVYLLLKSSEFVTHDLTDPFAECEDFQETCKPDIKYKLILRQWRQLHPAGEFRCFIRNRQVIAISQRHATKHYPFISGDKESIIEDIKQIFNSKIKQNFPSENYVVDIYRKEKGKVKIMDFNPFSSITDGLLFTWQELHDIDATSDTSLEPILRHLETDAGVQPSPYSCYTMPVDFVHLSTGEDPLKLMDFLQLKIQSQNDEDDSDDELETGPRNDR